MTKTDPNALVTVQADGRRPGVAIPPPPADHKVLAPYCIVSRIGRVLHENLDRTTALEKATEMGRKGIAVFVLDSDGNVAAKRGF